MPKLRSFANFNVIMFARDHAPPHIHCKGPDIDGTILIRTLENDRGIIPTSALVLAVAFVATYQAELLDVWEAYAAGEAPDLNVFGNGRV